MKPKSIITLLLGIAASLCLATQCPKEENPNELPPETQEGKNTFGCYVNGELYINEGKYLPALRDIGAIYNQETNRLEVFSLAGIDGSIHLFIDDPREGENILSIGYFTPAGTHRACWGFGCETCGHVLISKFDPANRVISGTFEFSGKCMDVYSSEKPLKYFGDSIVHVTEGRFDIKLEQ